MKIRKLHEDNELEKRAKQQKKHGTGLSPFCTLNKDAGNVEHNIMMFNKMSSPVEGISNNPVSGPHGGEVGVAESLIESTSTVDLHYDDLEVTIVTRLAKAPSYHFEYDHDEAQTVEEKIAHDHTVPKQDVVEFLMETVTDEDFPEIDDSTDAELENFVNKNFDSLFNKYEAKILDNYREQAREDAERRMNESVNLTESVDYTTEQFLIELGQTQDEEIYKMYLSKDIDADTALEIKKIRTAYIRYARVDNEDKMMKLVDKVRNLLTACSNKVFEEVKGSNEYIIMAVTHDGKKQYYNVSSVPHWVDNGKDGTIFDDMDEAREIWFKIDKKPFKRVMIPNYDPRLMNEALIPVDMMYRKDLLRDRISMMMDDTVGKFFQTLPQYNDEYRVKTKTGTPIMRIQFDTSNPESDDIIFSIDGRNKQVFRNERDAAKAIIDTARRTHSSSFDVAVESVELDDDIHSECLKESIPDNWTNYNGAWIYPVYDGWEGNLDGLHYSADTEDELKVKIDRAIKNGWTKDNKLKQYFKEDADSYEDPDIFGDASNYEFVSSKSVMDSDGFYTDYTWYRRSSDGLNVFVFGDNEVYGPEDGYFDFETDNDWEAEQWFSSYNGFEEDILDEAAETSAYERTAKKVINYCKNNPGRYTQGDDLIDLLDDLSETGVFTIPKMAPGFKCKDAHNVTQREAEKYFKLVILNTDLEHKLNSLCLEEDADVHLKLSGNMIEIPIEDNSEVGELGHPIQQGIGDPRRKKEVVSEATATLERPLSKLDGTLSSVLLAHKDEVDTLFDRASAIEFLDRIMPEVKSKAYVVRVKQDILKSRRNPVEYFYNIILKGDGDGTDRGGAVTKRAQVRKWARENLNEAMWEKGDPVTLWWKDPSWDKNTPCYASCTYIGRTRDGKYKFESDTYGWLYLLDLENKKITTPRGKVFDVWNDSGWLHEDFTDVVSTEDIVSWLSEHEQAYEDAQRFFGDVAINNVPREDLISWIADHDQLYSDLKRFFTIADESLNEHVKYPNGMPVTEMDLERALDYMYGTDRNPEWTYTDAELQKAVYYWMDKTDPRPDGKSYMNEALNTYNVTFYMDSLDDNVMSGPSTTVKVVADSEDAARKIIEKRCQDKYYIPTVTKIEQVANESMSDEDIDEWSLSVYDDDALLKDNIWSVSDALEFIHENGGNIIKVTSPEAESKIIWKDGKSVGTGFIGMDYDADGNTIYAADGEDVPTHEPPKPFDVHKWLYGEDLDDTLTESRAIRAGDRVQMDYYMKLNNGALGTCTGRIGELCYVTWDDGTKSKEITSYLKLVETESLVNEWYEFSDDDVEDDLMHAAVYGGDSRYCRVCGAVKEYDEDGFAFCPECSKSEDLIEDWDDLEGIYDAYESYLDDCAWKQLEPMSFKEFKKNYLGPNYLEESSDEEDDDDEGKMVGVSFDVAAPSNMKNSEIEDIIRKAIASTDLDIPGYMEVHVLNEYLQEKLIGYKLTVNKDGKTFDDYACAYEEEGAIRQIKNKYGDDIEIVKVDDSRVIRESLTESDEEQLKAFLTSLLDDNVFDHLDETDRKYAESQTRKFLAKLDNESLAEASYGGAFDIRDDQYFMREDLVDCVEKVIEHLNETFDDTFEIVDLGMERNVLVLEVEGKKLGTYEDRCTIDMRKIHVPSDLTSKYSLDIASRLIAQIKSCNDM